MKPSFAPSVKASYTFIFLKRPATIKPVMMLMSKTAAMDMLVVFIVAASSCMNPQTMAAHTAHMPPRASTNVRLKRLTCWNNDVTITPTKVAINVVIRIGIKTSVGCAAPSCAR